MTRTTPGPWTAKPSEDGDTIWIGNDGEHAGCVPGYTDHPGNQANAALIAAAPDLLAALVLARKRIVYLAMNTRGTRHVASNEEHFFPIIDAAIQKAGGER